MRSQANKHHDWEAEHDPNPKLPQHHYIKPHLHKDALTAPRLGASKQVQNTAAPSRFQELLQQEGKQQHMHAHTQTHTHTEPVKSSRAVLSLLALLQLMTRLSSFIYWARQQVSSKGTDSNLIKGKQSSKNKIKIPNQHNVLPFSSKWTHRSCKNWKGKAEKLACFPLLGEAGNSFHTIF